ncbi:MAG: NYN domain-containing protein [Candidatus Omnitrophica bacterium]|nr:NYN domain-containing protein [Candidatus Omnitrophota bacterium]
MSLQYIIDGYNIINHRLFSRKNNKKIQGPRKLLLEFIMANRLCGSRRNKAVIVFDGYPESLKQETDAGEIKVIYSKDDSADERIKQMLERAGNPKTVIVVSDDKEIKFFTKSFGARAMSIEEFIKPKEKANDDEEDLSSHPKLTYTQMSRINKELRQVWLKQ